MESQGSDPLGRWWNHLFLPTGAVEANFTARNNSGVTIGLYFDTSENVHSFMLKGTTPTTIDDPKSLHPTTWVSGINKWNSIVGNYPSFFSISSTPASKAF